jgi:hypothetical protein
MLMPPWRFWPQRQNGCWPEAFGNGRQRIRESCIFYQSLGFDSVMSKVVEFPDVTLDLVLMKREL